MMGLFDRIFGNDRRDGSMQPASGAPSSADEQAIARYRYLVKTAPPEDVEQAHAEAFARLTPEQRRQVLDELSAELPASERAAAARGGDNPQALARVATRAEIRQPGAMERAFGRMGGGMGMGGLMAGTFLSTMAGAVLGTAIAHSFMDSHAADAGAAADANAGWNDAGFSDAGDPGGFDVGGGFDI